MFSNKNKKIIYLVIFFALIVCFIWLYVLKLNIKNINQQSASSVKNGIGLEDVKNRFNELINKSPLFNQPLPSYSENQAPVQNNIENITEKVSAELKDINQQADKILTNPETQTSQVQGAKTIKTLPEL